MSRISLPQNKNQFQSNAFPALIQYRYTDWTTRNDPPEVRAAKFEKLHQRWAPVALAVGTSLGGLYIKFGQLVSGMDGTVPEAYTEAFKVLQDKVPPRTFDQVIETIEADLKRPWHQVFESIERERVSPPLAHRRGGANARERRRPLGSASIGQVHRAVLKGGKKVAVKVQNPLAERCFRADLVSLREFTRIAQPEQVRSDTRTKR